MRTLKLFSPAKINLFFRILRRREDGYHDIASLVQCIDFGDTLTFSLGTEVDEFSSDDRTLGWNSNNLIYRAVQLFRQKTQLQFSLSVHLNKRIPMQAGLGGGSSNAATTLYALNQLLHTELSDQVLAQWGAQLGADVPCFFSLGRAFCEGVGEKLTLVAPQAESYWIAKPTLLSLATPAVYAQCIAAPAQISHQAPLMVNDLEQAAFKILPTLQQFKQQCVDLGFEQVVMTGSGTAFICRGNVKEPSLPDTLFIKATSLSRSLASWYPFV